ISAPALRVQADDAGNFAFDELFAGERTVLAFAAGFARAQSRVVMSPAVPAELELRLRTGATIHGRVTGANGSAAVGATVEWMERRGLFGVDAFWDRMRGKPEAVAPDGSYRLAALTPAEIRVLVSLGAGADLQQQERTLDLHDGEDVGWDVALGAGGVI